MEEEAATAASAARESESEIKKAIHARVPDFKKQADSLTLEGVRRALEKDMGLETHSLDAHKKFIKQCVDKVFHDSDDNISNNACEMVEAKANHVSKEGSEDVPAMPASKKLSSRADEQVVRSRESEKDPSGEEDPAAGSNIDEDMIKEAIDKRASYFRENSGTLTLQGVRRTLEEDLKLAKKALDAFKKFITTELDRVLEEPANGTKKSSKQGPRKDADQESSKASKRAHEDSDTSENYSRSGMEDSDNDEDARPRKRGSRKVKVVKRQKKAIDEKKMSTPKAKKVVKRDLDRSTEEQDGNSEEGNSRSSAEEDNKRKRQPAPAYGKQAEHLRRIIKSCGMSVPPHVYRRAKQAPENKRDAWLIRELEDILGKEGLSKNPSEKEIKAVKKRKERAKELEGIDMSNIITSSRRRSASNFIPLPPPPKVVADSNDSDDEDDADDDEDEEIVEGADESDNDGAEGDDGSADDAEEKY